ncbi:hypothetical protein BT96DRAFT_1007545 [Gymnopus androsaceus JB14]|uniref:Uncharacterized protein n=1 Tax=Gymnopus androsaceus JB14 TaxID=1447944 RepID=A0A6A4GHT5_9AGAR|nr:hypothetical protein BT96DRAFT_1007545 [Gymnopus androsaceus JB14]
MAINRFNGVLIVPAKIPHTIDTTLISSRRFSKGPNLDLGPKYDDPYPDLYVDLQSDVANFSTTSNVNTSAYIHAYLRSPRPDAPIPPMPHNQTSPPSPSLMLKNRYESTKDSYPSFRPVAPAGSPYPYPFTHV